MTCIRTIRVSKLFMIVLSKLKRKEDKMELGLVPLYVNLGLAKIKVLCH